MGAIIAFWSVLEHHAISIRPIYNKMRAQGKEVVGLFNRPVGELFPYSCIVSGTAPDIPVSKRCDTIYHFHSLSPLHIKPSEGDYKYIPLFKGVMFPGMWWVDKWPKKPEHWAVVGWPKNDLLQPMTKRHEPTVLFAASMFNFERMKTLATLIELSKKIGFRLIVKPHHGIEAWYPKQLEAMARLVQMEDSTADISAYFHLADVLVSESSGALWEFMATGRPSIFMEHSKKWGRSYPGGVLEASFETLEETLGVALRSPGKLSEERTLWRERVMGKLDGKATDRAIEFIEGVFG